MIRCRVIYSSVDGYPPRWRFGCMDPRCRHRSLAYATASAANDQAVLHLLTYHSEPYANPASAESRRTVAEIRRGKS